MTQSPSDELEKDKRQDQGPTEELKAWVELLQQAVAAGATLSQLALLELRLAIADGGRLIVLGLLMLPLTLLAWSGVSVLAAWSAFSLSGSVALGICTFVAVQVITLSVMAVACVRYRKSLSLPGTRRHVRQFMEGTKPDAQATKS